MAVELSLKGNGVLQRTLSMRCDEFASFTAAVYPLALKDMRIATIAWASAAVGNCRLCSKSHDYCLWVGHAAFDLSEAEAKQVRELYEPLGMRIQIETVPTADTADAR